MILDRFPEVRALPREQQLQLAEELFTASCAGDPPLTTEETTLLEKRLREYEANPAEVSLHTEVMERFAARKRQRAARLINA